MRLLLFYLILTGMFLLSANIGGPDYRNPGSYAPSGGFHEVEQDGTISASTINAAGIAGPVRDEFHIRYTAAR